MNKSEKDKHLMVSRTCEINKTKQINKQNEMKLIDTENRLVVATVDMGLGAGKKWIKGLNKYKLLVTN